MSQYLIDTNILSEPIKPQPNPKVIETMQRNTEDRSDCLHHLARNPVRL